jgi:hypothetical protein
MMRPVRIEVPCPWCGPVFIEPVDLHCEREPGGQLGICELRCPICTRTVFLPTTGFSVEAVRQMGAGGIDGIIPFELLERHRGAPLSWDDLVELQRALAGTLYPQEEISA